MVYKTSAVRLLGIALATSACSLEVPTDTGGDNPIPVQIDFCTGDVPVWFAYQHSAGPFSVITPDANGTFSFDATQRTAIVFVRQNGADSRTDIIFTSNLDLDQISGFTCLDEVGPKQVNGSVSGLLSDQLGLVTMSFSSVYLTQAQSSFTLTQLVDRPLDVIASRIDVVGTEQHANRTIVRRSQNPVSGSTMADLDFSSDGFDPSQHTATVSGFSTEPGFLMNNFFSQLGTSHTLSYVEPVFEGVNPFVAIPSAQTAAGDYHDLFAIANAQNGGIRGVERYFRTAGNQTLVLGPALAEPLVSVTSSTGNVQLRVQLVGQQAYSTMVTADFHQQTNFASTDVSLSVTASYFGGTPFEWDLPMPNFAGLPGYQNSWALKVGNIDWTIAGYFGRPQLVFGGAPNEGETVQFASRSSTVAASQVYRTAREVPRPRHFRRWR
ncbi:MAG: hypothetical protein ACRENU_07430 [Gemmatimonadaceae bacterium]